MSSYLDAAEGLTTVAWSAAFLVLECLPRRQACRSGSMWGPLLLGTRARLVNGREQELLDLCDASPADHLGRLADNHVLLVPDVQFLDRVQDSFPYLDERGANPHSPPTLQRADSDSPAIAFDHFLDSQILIVGHRMPHWFLS
ncbi:hypothetical protein SPHINGO361_140304 [Sphingomonas sp. EC-HK361]|nr:hypothetical protein SPHINGO361_140304 [Sphingomonas sp. EC-HK361]